MQLNYLILVLVVAIGALAAVVLLAMAVARIRQRERETSARAAASERLSEQIIASLSSGLLVAGVSGEVRILNPAGARLLGVGDVTRGGSLRELTGGTGGPLSVVIDECLAGRVPIVRRTLEVDRATYLGQVTHLGVSVSPMLDEHGKPQGAICLFADLSAVVDLEERVRLQESLAQVGELTAGIAHEFRNGLATIHGYGRLLVPEDLQAEYRPYVEGIRQETVALREVVDNFLAFARPATLSVSTVSLSRLVDRAADEIRDELRRRGGEVIVRGEFPEVDGDEVLLRQAISNLCRNAVDASASAAGAPQVTLEGAVSPDHAEVRLAVIDNGPGFDPDQRERMFRPFFTTKTGGTGLGLALAQKIIVTHNGRVTAFLEETGGARMEVVLPLRRASHQA